MRTTIPFTLAAAAVLLFACSKKDEIQPDSNHAGETGMTAGTGGTSAVGAGPGAGAGGASQAQTGHGGASGAADAGHGGASGAADAGHAGTAGASPQFHCPVGMAGPTPVLIPRPAGGQPYCIDSTEVTAGQYAAFIKEKGSVPKGQVKGCEDNIAYPKVAGEGANCPPDAYAPDVAPDVPVRCVDWCDATAYCGWAGKRLCGRIGGGPAELPYADLDTPIPATLVENAAVDEWYNACSQGGKTAYESGDTFKKECLAVTDPPEGGCTGSEPPYSHLHGMNNMVGEWTAWCDPAVAGSASTCVIRTPAVGGLPDSTNAACRSWGLTWGFPGTGWSGIRCCADAVP
jgi:formylglycine-generating enzyme